MQSQSQVLVLQVLVLSRALHMALHDSMLVGHLARTCPQLACKLNDSHIILWLCTGTFKSLPSVISDLCGPSKPNAADRKRALRFMDFLLRTKLLKVTPAVVLHKISMCCVWYACHAWGTAMMLLGLP